MSEGAPAIDVAAMPAVQILAGTPAPELPPESLAPGTISAGGPPAASGPTPVVAAAKPRPPGRATKEDDDDEPPERKRNRTAVRNYRARKKAYTERLEMEVERLRIQNFLLLKAMGQRTDLDKGMISLMPQQLGLNQPEQLAAQLLALQSQDVLGAQPQLQLPLTAQGQALLGLQGIGAMPIAATGAAASAERKAAELMQASYPMGLLGGAAQPSLQMQPLGVPGAAPGPVPLVGIGAEGDTGNGNLTAVLKALLQQQQLPRQQGFGLGGQQQGSATLTMGLVSQELQKHVQQPAVPQPLSLQLGQAAAVGGGGVRTGVEQAAAMQSALLSLGGHGYGGAAAGGQMSSMGSAPAVELPGSRSAAAPPGPGEAGSRAQDRHGGAAAT